jgi:hypothetical protein
MERDAGTRRPRITSSDRSSGTYEQFENAKPSWLWDEWALEIGCPARAMHAWHNAEYKFPKIAPLPEKGRVYLINRSLTTAHLDHNPANLEDSNIVSLCEHCHLKADAHHHFANARRSVAAQVGQAWLSPEIEAAAEMAALWNWVRYFSSLHDVLLLAHCER